MNKLRKVLSFIILALLAVVCGLVGAAWGVADQFTLAKGASESYAHND